MSESKPDPVPEAKKRTFHDRIVLTGKYGRVAELTVITGGDGEPYFMIDASQVGISFHVGNLAELVEMLHQALHNHLGVRS